MAIKTRLYIPLAILGIAAIVITGFYISFAVQGTFRTDAALSITFAIITPTIYFFLAAVFANYLAYRGSEKKLLQENLYYLGKETGFYNYYFFSKRVKVLNLFRSKKYEAYMLAFTPMKLVVARNAFRNDVINNYLGLLADALENRFRIKDKKIFKNLAYCYYHGIFLFAVIGDVDLVNFIANEIEDIVYNVAKDNQFNLYIQPYFGIAASSRKNDNLLVDVDHACNARMEAEKLYKQIEYYNPDNVMTTDGNAINKLSKAIDDKEFVVYYQPKFSLDTNEFVSTEALVRWNSPTEGIIPPIKFIELAENGGLIHKLDIYVFTQVCLDMQENKKRGRRFLPSSVNFSMQEFYDDNFINELVEICKEYNVSTSNIYIEITESTSQVNTFMTVSIVKRLKDAGFKVLMDDFGTGYSNIQNLMNIPFDAVKLDRSYITQIEDDPKAYELVKFLINLCKINKMSVVAEGVDNEKQVEILRKIKCNIIQGYYYSKPIPKLELDAFLLTGGNKFEKLKKGDKK